MSLLGGALRPAEPRSSEPDPRWRGVWPGVSAARRTVQSSLFLLRQFPSSLTAGPCDIACDRMRTEQRAAGLGSRRPVVAGASCPCSGRTLGAGAVPAAPGRGGRQGPRRATRAAGSEREVLGTAGPSEEVTDASEAGAAERAPQSPHPGGGPRPGGGGAGRRARRERVLGEPGPRLPVPRLGLQLVPASPTCRPSVSCLSSDLDGPPVAARGTRHACSHRPPQTPRGRACDR